jgi:RNA polymerase sigma-70 factor, ECF subfamily
MDIEHEKHLIEKAQQGDRNALGELFDTYLPKVYRRVCSLVPETDAEDVTQDIFVSLTRSIKSFRRDSSFSTWTFNIIKRRVADYYRKSYRQAPQIELDEDAVIIGENPQMSDEELDIKRVLTFLPENQREVILLRLVEGLPFAEVASHMGIEVGAAKVRFYRAIKACQKKLAAV